MTVGFFSSDSYSGCSCAVFEDGDASSSSTDDAGNLSKSKPLSSFADCKNTSSALHLTERELKEHYRKTILENSDEDDTSLRGCYDEEEYHQQQSRNFRKKQQQLHQDGGGGGGGYDAWRRDQDRRERYFEKLNYQCEAQKSKSGFSASTAASTDDGIDSTAALSSSTTLSERQRNSNRRRTTISTKKKPETRWKKLKGKILPRLNNKQPLRDSNHHVIDSRHPDEENYFDENGNRYKIEIGSIGKSSRGGSSTTSKNQGRQRKHGSTDVIPLDQFMNNKQSSSNQVVDEQHRREMDDFSLVPLNTLGSLVALDTHNPHHHTATEKVVDGDLIEDDDIGTLVDTQGAICPSDTVQERIQYHLEIERQKQEEAEIEKEEELQKEKSRIALLKHRELQRQRQLHNNAGNNKSFNTGQSSSNDINDDDDNIDMKCKLSILPSSSTSPLSPSWKEDIGQLVHGLAAQFQSTIRSSFAAGGKDGEDDDDSDDSSVGDQIGTNNGTPNHRRGASF